MVRESQPKSRDNSSSRPGRFSRQHLGGSRSAYRDPGDASLSEDAQPQPTESLMKGQIIDEVIESSPVDTHKVFKGIFRHVLLMLITTAIGAAGVSAMTYLLSRTYTAEAFLLFKTQEEGDKPLLLMSNYRLNRLSMATMLEMMKLPVHYKAVKSILGTELTVPEMIEMTKVESPPGRSNLIRIETKGRDPALTMDLANALANVIVKHSEDLNRRQLQEAYDYFSSQHEIAKQKANQVNKEIAEFREQNPAFEQDATNLSIVDKASQARTSYEAALLSYNSLLVEYENLKREVGKIPEHTVRYAYEDSPLKDRITQTEMALLDARTRYAPDNPKIKILESSLKELRNMMSEQSLDDTKGKVYEKNPLKEQLNIELMRLQGKLRSAQKAKEELEAAADVADKGLLNLPKEQLQFAKLLQVKKANDEEVRELDQALRATQLLLSLGKGEVELYQSADSAQPLTNKWDRWLPFFPILGGLLGLLVGAAIAMVIEAFDRHVCTPKQIDIHYTVKCISTIPEIPRLAKRNVEKELLFYIRDLADYFDTLKDGDTPRSLAITSAIRGEGKSCLAYHLARYYAARLGKKVVYINFDPVANPFLPAGNVPVATVDKYLHGRADLSDIVQPGEPDIIRTSADSGMAELIKSERMTRLWHELDNNYDVVVVDTPSIIDEDYAAGLLRWVEVPMLLVGSSVAKKRYIDSALHELEKRGVRPYGIILNRVLGVYIDDVRVQAERKQARKDRWRKALSFGRNKTEEATETNAS